MIAALNDVHKLQIPDSTISRPIGFAEGFGREPNEDCVHKEDTGHQNNLDVKIGVSGQVASLERFAHRDDNSQNLPAPKSSEDGLSQSPGVCESGEMSLEFSESKLMNEQLPVSDRGRQNIEKEIKGVADLTVPGGYHLKAGDFTEKSATNQIVLDDGVTSIGSMVFADFRKMRRIHLSNRLASIHITAFTDCVKLDRIDFNGIIYTSIAAFFAAAERMGVNVVRDVVS
ncbi:leucine-rich repeat protein [bacterium]|nr:leucine-rich repeat protein [bacterium]